MEQDFIASELMSELKKENQRKDQIIQRKDKHLLIVIITAFIAILATILGCFIYLYQYDFTGTYELSNSAEGVYALIDSEGNIISSDIPQEQIEEFINGQIEENSESY